VSALCGAQALGDAMEAEEAPAMGVTTHTREGEPMRQASVSQLKATLRACLAWVKAGEEVVVTERGTPIAKIVPVAQPPAAVPAALAALVQAGLVTRGSGHVPDEVRTLPRPKDPEGRGRRALTEERETGR
jgi:prevent-host-death family protein